MTQTREQLKTNILSCICDNSKEKITANRLRDILIDIVDNMYTKEDIAEFIDKKKKKSTVININGKEDIDNKVTNISEDSTDIEYPSAKAVYDYVNSLQDKNDGFEYEKDIQNLFKDKEDIDNKVTIISENSTDDEYPSAKAVYDLINSIQEKPTEEIIEYYGAPGYIKNDTEIGELSTICKSKSGKFIEKIIFNIGIGSGDSEVGDKRKKNSFFITEFGKVFALSHNIIGGKTYSDIFNPVGADQYIRLA